jgi:1-pyrroline-5-carboxylate dehydrogenase
MKVSSLLRFQSNRILLVSSNHRPSWASLDANNWSGSSPHEQFNLVNGEWTKAAKTETIIDPLNGEPFLHVPLTSNGEITPFVNSLKRVSKTGLHNPFRDVARYNMLGRVSSALAAALREPVTNDYFVKLVQRTSPKSYIQAKAEVDISAKFLDNFCGDNVRYLARSFGVSGDHDGQTSVGHRFPYGPVTIITPFNFPIEIPALQVMGALYMGNKPLVKVDSKVSVVFEQFLRLMHHVGLPKTDVDMINCDGPTMNALLLTAQPRMTLFTGSSRVAEKLAKELAGKVKLEDAGFDWKVLGSDVPGLVGSEERERMLDYVAWVSDQDAYACSGQKCSAQSMLIAHSNWIKAGLLQRIQTIASKRTLSDLTIGPVLTWTTSAMLNHIANLLKIPGSRVLFGGKELKNHTIPKMYGALEPTAVFVPLKALLSSPEHYAIATTEVFGPLQVVTEWQDGELPLVLETLERMENHLTAGIVSNDPIFINQVVGSTVNGTTYVGMRARTTGAPQNHWFGPAGDPRGAGIGTKEAIQLVWSCHREVISDVGPVSSTWTIPKAS